MSSIHHESKKKQCLVPETQETCLSSPCHGCIPQSTYIYRIQSSVWRLPNYWPPPPLHPASMSFPLTKGGGGGGGALHTRREVRARDISEDARHWIVLLQCKPSTMYTYSTSYCLYCRRPKAVEIFRLFFFLHDFQSGILGSCRFWDGLVTEKTTHSFPFYMESYIIVKKGKIFSLKHDI
jgi:hypothetical protein